MVLEVLALTSAQWRSEVPVTSAACRKRGSAVSRGDVAVCEASLRGQYIPASGHWGLAIRVVGFSQGAKVL